MILTGDNPAVAAKVCAATTVFARVSPEHKAQVIRAQRRTGADVDSATDVAKDAADVLLLEKNLDVLADAVMGGRRIFAPGHPDPGDLRHPDPAHPVLPQPPERAASAGRAGRGDGRGRIARQPVRPHALLPAAPGLFFLALVLMVVAYLLLIELGKYWFYRSYRESAAPRPVPGRRRRVHRRAARFTTYHRLRR